MSKQSVKTAGISESEVMRMFKKEREGLEKVVFFLLPNNEVLDKKKFKFNKSKSYIVSNKTKEKKKRNKIILWGSKRILCVPFKVPVKKGKLLNGYMRNGFVIGDIEFELDGLNKGDTLAINAPAFITCELEVDLPSIEVMGKK